MEPILFLIVLPVGMFIFGMVMGYWLRWLTTKD